MPKETRIETGHAAFEQFSDEKAEKILPHITPPGEHTPAVSRFETIREEEN